MFLTLGQWLNFYVPPFIKCTGFLSQEAFLDLPCLGYRPSLVFPQYPILHPAKHLAQSSVVSWFPVFLARLDYESRDHMCQYWSLLSRHLLKKVIIECLLCFRYYVHLFVRGRVKNNRSGPCLHMAYIPVGGVGGSRADQYQIDQHTEWRITVTTMEKNRTEYKGIGMPEVGVGVGRACCLGWGDQRRSPWKRGMWRKTCRRLESGEAKCTPWSSQLLPFGFRHKCPV